MPHAYTEDQQAAHPHPASPSGRGNDGVFAELGWTTVSALEVTFGAIGTLLRETKGEVVMETT